MINWKKVGRTVSEEGSTIIYAGEGTDLTIESRKRKIPHAGGNGYNGRTFWWHTTYFVLKDGKEVKERFSLADAKEYAEGLK